MRVDEVIARLRASLSREALGRAAAALGDELPRWRRDMLRHFRAELARISRVNDSFADGYLTAMADICFQYEETVSARFAVTEAKLIDAWNACEGTDRTPGEGELGFTISWCAIGVGFGETTFYMGRDGVMHCDNECMDREFFAHVLAKFLEGVKMDHGQE